MPGRCARAQTTIHDTHAHTRTWRVVDVVHTQADDEASLSTQRQDATHAHAQTTNSDTPHTGTRRFVNARTPHTQMTRTTTKDAHAHAHNDE
jgi:hypothetical protein